MVRLGIKRPDLGDERYAKDNLFYVKDVEGSINIRFFELTLDDDYLVSPETAPTLVNERLDPDETERLAEKLLDAAERARAFRSYIGDADGNIRS